MLKIYEINLDTEVAPSLYSLLSTAEQQFAQTFRNEIIKKQHLTVRVALRQVLAAHLKTDAKSLCFAKTAYGKPYLVDYPDCQFNISHSGNRLVVAISHAGAVGIDIEQSKREGRDFAGLVAKCFAPAEKVYWHTLSDSDKTTEFYRFWTRKEALVKAVGRGLAMGLQECEIATQGTPAFIRMPEDSGNPADWLLFDLPVKSGFYGALVMANSGNAQPVSLPEIMPFEIKLTSP